MRVVRDLVVTASLFSVAALVINHFRPTDHIRLIIVSIVIVLLARSR